jgi:hypothetical protein
VLLTIPDSTSQKFILLGQISRKDQQTGMGRYAAVFLDFAPTRSRQCGENDFEKWYARSSASECIMGHKVCFVHYMECNDAHYMFIDFNRRFAAMVQETKT